MGGWDWRWSFRWDWEFHIFGLAVFGLDYQIDHFDNQVYPPSPPQLAVEELGGILSLYACPGTPSSLSRRASY